MAAIFGKNVRLVSSDGETFEVPVAVASLSALVRSMIMEEEDDAEPQQIPLPNVRSDTLRRVVEFMNHHIAEPMTEIPSPLKSANLGDFVQERYVAFLADCREHEHLYQLILAANYMDCKPLLVLTCAKIACMVKSRTPEEDKRVVDGYNSMISKEEQDAVREEYKWCEDA